MASVVMPNWLKPLDTLDKNLLQKNKWIGAGIHRLWTFASNCSTLIICPDKQLREQIQKITKIIFKTVFPDGLILNFGTLSKAEVQNKPYLLIDDIFPNVLHYSHMSLFLADISQRGQPAFSVLFPKSEYSDVRVQAEQSAVAYFQMILELTTLGEELHIDVREDEESRFGKVVLRRLETRTFPEIPRIFFFSQHSEGKNLSRLKIIPQLPAFQSQRRQAKTLERLDDLDRLKQLGHSNLLRDFTHGLFLEDSTGSGVLGYAVFSKVGTDAYLEAILNGSTEPGVGTILLEEVEAYCKCLQLTDIYLQARSPLEEYNTKNFSEIDLRKHCMACWTNSNKHPDDEGLVKFYTNRGYAKSQLPHSLYQIHMTGYNIFHKHLQ